MTKIHNSKNGALHEHGDGRARGGATKGEFGRLEDRQLVARCLEKSASAWSELYERCHDRLLHAIRKFAGQQADQDVIEEIAARSWYAVTKSDFELLARYDAQRGKLSSYLAGIARKEFAVYLRSERRRRAREQVVGGKGMQAELVSSYKAQADIDDFLTLLTSRERDFFLRFLVSGDSTESDSSLSSVNIRQLRHRVRNKVKAFFE